MPRVGNSVAITSELATNSEPAQYSGWLPSALTRRGHQASTVETVGPASASASRVFHVQTQTKWYLVAWTVVPIRISAYRSLISREAELYSASESASMIQTKRGSSWPLRASRRSSSTKRTMTMANTAQPIQAIHSGSTGEETLNPQ